MTEVNEEIVKQYLELQGFFVQTDVKYLREKEETGKKSSGWGDVDIIAIHPSGKKYLVEVNGGIWRPSLHPSLVRNRTSTT